MRLDNETDLYCEPRINKGPVYYDEKNERILHIVKDKIYFESDKLFRIESMRADKPRRIRAMWEIKEKLNEMGCQYLGEL